MNQDNNGFNQNNFNLQANNGIPNNQPLNNQQIMNEQFGSALPNNNEYNQNQINNMYQQSINNIQMDNDSTINSNLSNIENQNHSINIKNNNKSKLNIAIIIAFILMIVSFLVLIIFKNYICLGFSVISLIINLINVKRKNILNIISLIGNILIIVFCAVSFICSVNKVDDIIDDAKIESRKREEELLETYSEYVVNVMILENKLSKEEDKILIKKDLDDYNQNYHGNCEFYIITSFKDNKYEAYIKCNDYITEGFDEKYLSNTGLDNSINKDNNSNITQNSDAQQNSSQDANNNQAATLNAEDLKRAEYIYDALELTHVTLLLESKEITLNNIVNSFNLDGYYIVDTGHVNTSEGRNLCNVSVDNEKIYLDCDSINYYNYININ